MLAVAPDGVATHRGAPAGANAAPHALQPGPGMTRRSERTLASMAHGIQRCRKCPLHRGRHHAVPGEGAEEVRLVFVGEAPGAAEDRTGLPFRGAAGRCFDAMLGEHGLGRDAAFVTSLVKCRPPDNRPPRTREIHTCVHAWLFPQLARIGPAVVVALGRLAAKTLLDTDIRIRRDHGVRDAPQGWITVVTCHPAAAMRFPEMASIMREDLAALARLL